MNRVDGSGRRPRRWRLMRDADERETLLEEIAEHRRGYPYITVFIVAKAIHEARLGLSRCAPTPPTGSYRDGD